jgi:hypothetical protein
VLSKEAVKQDIQWARDRHQLWNAAEARKDARVAREYELALPHELTQEQRVGLARAFAQELADRLQCAVDVAIHKPHRHGDQRNHHAHLYATTRQFIRGLRRREALRRPPLAHIGFGFTCGFTRTGRDCDRVSNGVCASTLSRQSRALSRVAGRERRVSKKSPLALGSQPSRERTFTSHILNAGCAPL